MKALSWTLSCFGVAGSDEESRRARFATDGAVLSARCCLAAGAEGGLLVAVGAGVGAGVAEATGIHETPDFSDLWKSSQST